MHNGELDISCLYVTSSLVMLMRLMNLIRGRVIISLPPQLAHEGAVARACMEEIRIFILGGIWVLVLDSPPFLFPFYSRFPLEDSRLGRFAVPQSLG